MDKKKRSIRRRMWMLFMMGIAAVLAGCGSVDKGTATLEGSCVEILNQVYEKAELDPDLRDAMDRGYYETITVDESMEEYLLGTTELNYTDSACSMPFANATAYQCIVLRLDESEDMVKAKQLLLDNADPVKWICVEAESVVVENVGDVLLYVMADEQTADAIKTAFLSLGES